MIGALALAFRGHIVSKDLLKKLTFLITAFAIIIVGTRMQPTFIALCIGAFATIFLGMRNHTNFSKMNLCYGVCITIAIASSVTKVYSSPMAKASIEAFASWWVAQALIPNLPFCEEPFATSPWAAQGASALAHMPYVPAILLAIQSVSPTVMPHLDIKNGPDPKNARRVRAMLWLQFAVQAYTGIGGHVLPNPRMIMNQEISIVLTFSLLFVLLKITTKSNVQLIIDDWKVCILLTMLPVLGFLTIGLMPLIFTSFAAVVALGTAFKGAFGRITPYGSKMLLSAFVPTIAVLAVETVSCDYLQQNISQNFPWHLGFDFMFWQVVGSALDLVVITPAPGKFMFKDC